MLNEAIKAKVNQQYKAAISTSFKSQTADGDRVIFAKSNATAPLVQH